MAAGTKRRRPTRRRPVGVPRRHVGEAVAGADEQPHCGCVYDGMVKPSVSTRRLCLSSEPTCGVGACFARQPTIGVVYGMLEARVERVNRSSRVVWSAPKRTPETESQGDNTRRTRSRCWRNLTARNKTSAARNNGATEPERYRQASQAVGRRRACLRLRTEGLAWLLGSCWAVRFGCSAERGQREKRQEREMWNVGGERQETRDGREY